MDIDFKSKKLKRLCSEENHMVRHFGDQVALRLQDRLLDLLAADSLADLSMIPGARPHPLTGERDGQFAVDVTRSVRIVCEPNHDALPALADGGIDRSKVTAITIVFVGDYHE